MRIDPSKNRNLLHTTQLRLVVGGGFEPPKASPTDLQSVPFDHSGTPPSFNFNQAMRGQGIQVAEFTPCKKIIHGASGGIRTPGPLITNQLLYQLSYAGLTT